jgi:hypothetical protein
MRLGLKSKCGRQHLHFVHQIDSFTNHHMSPIIWWIHESSPIDPNFANQNLITWYDNFHLVGPTTKTTLFIYFYKLHCVFISPNERDGEDTKWRGS